MSQRQWIHVRLAKKTDGKNNEALYNKRVVTGKTHSDFLHQECIKHVSHSVITLTDSVLEFKPMPVCPCGLVNLLGEEHGCDQYWNYKLLISTWLPQPFTPI